MPNEALPRTLNGLHPEVFNAGLLVLDVWHRLSPDQKGELVTHVLPRLVDELFIDGTSPQELMDLSNALDKAGSDLHHRASTIKLRSDVMQEQPEYREF